MMTTVAEMRLRGDEQHGQAGEEERHQDVAKRAAVERGRVVDVLGQGDDGQHLHQLRGLQVEGAQVEPAARTADHLAVHEHRDQEDDADRVEHVADARDDAIVEAGRSEGRLVYANGQLRTCMILQCRWRVYPSNGGKP
jgi:hypothetical protein